MIKCFKCGKEELYNEKRVSHVNALLLFKNKYMERKYLCFKCSPAYMIHVKSKILKDLPFEIKKCDLCNKPTVTNIGSLSPYLCYQDNRDIITCGCIFVK